ncbi:hypothetical protein P7K49_028556 [Saguinus oedipus]|uniref:Sec39 domain-containing protein n=1 Tax=Saguinus oedipus TaxID=9490 RepID=A0ABQ9U4N7_SAGOE|nr:hypothetical protein P7K49_028556 [Saguinus oedipus]
MAKSVGQQLLQAQKQATEKGYQGKELEEEAGQCYDRIHKLSAYYYLLQQKIIPDQDQLMAVALDCVYNCERNDQLSLCYDILECLPERGYGLISDQRKFIFLMKQMIVTNFAVYYDKEKKEQWLCQKGLQLYAACLLHELDKTEVTPTLHDMVDQLEQILSVSELLEKHGLEKPVSFVKNTQSSSEEARKLMVRLTRHTGRNLMADVSKSVTNVFYQLEYTTVLPWEIHIYSKAAINAFMFRDQQPPVSESHWRTLLQDMLTMQQNVYTCLDADACYEIFTESLLCSSRLENIHLAGQMMHCSACSANLPASIAYKGKPHYRVSYEKSIDLVLAASREYFNSSTNLTDSCMDLARCCLQLITDRPPAIQEEVDLIEAVGCLEEFGVKILPLQAFFAYTPEIAVSFQVAVRLCPDRISLIKECISQSPTCYKQSTKLLGLAELLRVAGEDPEERRGQVLILLVEQALRFHDYKAANMHCQELMDTGYPESWDVCSQLGQSEGYQDLATRQELMAFALTHCPPSSIELLLTASSSLQTEILYQRVNFQIHHEGGENISASSLTSKAVQETPVVMEQYSTT